MREVDLIPASYRRSLAQAFWLKCLAGIAFGLVVSTAAARVWLDAVINDAAARVEELQAQQTITVSERDRLTALTQDKESYQEQLYLLKGLRSGAAATELLKIIDQAIIDNDLWFTHWSFRRAGITNSDGEEIQTGYFVVVSDDNNAGDTWRVETHMTITGQARDHAALSEFVQRLLARPEIENVRVRRTGVQRYATHSLVDFDLAVIILRQVAE